MPIVVQIMIKYFEDEGSVATLHRRQDDMFLAKCKDSLMFNVNQPALGSDAICNHPSVSGAMNILSVSVSRSGFLLALC